MIVQPASHCGLLYHCGDCGGGCNGCCWGGEGFRGAPPEAWDTPHPWKFNKHLRNDRKASSGICIQTVSMDLRPNASVLGFGAHVANVYKSMVFGQMMTLKWHSCQKYFMTLGQRNWKKLFWESQYLPKTIQSSFNILNRGWGSVALWSAGPSIESEGSNENLF